MGRKLNTKQAHNKTSIFELECVIISDDQSDGRALRDVKIREKNYLHEENRQQLTSICPSFAGAIRSYDQESQREQAIQVIGTMLRVPIACAYKFVRQSGIRKAAGLVLSSGPALPHFYVDAT